MRNLVALLFLFCAMPSYACKEAVLNEKFPIYDLSGYNYILIVKINSVVSNDKSRYGGFSSFVATVQEALKGSLDRGIIISGKPEHEEARAVCPAHLKVDETYLLLLNKRNGFYHLSRFSFPTSSTHLYYSKYLKDIKEIISKN